MAWVKYNKNGIVNLNRIIDIQLRKELIQRDSYGWAICLYDSKDNKYSTKIYHSLEECTHDFEYLTGCLRSSKQFIDIQIFPQKLA